MTLSEQLWQAFTRATEAYHVADSVDAPLQNPYPQGSLEAVLYEKNWIDAVQWHLEDIIRDPEIEPVKALAIKRRIDRLNQQRTDMVERIDDHFLALYNDVPKQPGATLNTESVAWAIDRFSILKLKIYHMQEQVSRGDADEAHLARCKSKLAVLTEQHADLGGAIDQLVDDIAHGRKFVKVYRQMKMYNDPALNPVLYAQGKQLSTE